MWTAAVHTTKITNSNPLKLNIVLRFKFSYCSNSSFIHSGFTPCTEDTRLTIQEFLVLYSAPNTDTTTYLGILQLWRLHTNYCDTFLWTLNVSNRFRKSALIQYSGKGKHFNLVNFEWATLCRCPVTENSSIKGGHHINVLSITWRRKHSPLPKRSTHIARRWAKSKERIKLQETAYSSGISRWQHLTIIYTHKLRLRCVWKS